jgi:hypothetical protein
MPDTQTLNPKTMLAARLKRIDELPKPLQEYLWSGQVEKTFLSVMSKQQVSEERTRATVSLLVGRVLIGELHPNSFIKTLAEEGNVPLEKARAVARDISAQVFAPVRNELMTVYGIGAATEPAEKIPAVPKQTEAPSSPTPTTQTAAPSAGPVTLNKPPTVPAPPQTPSVPGGAMQSRGPATIVVQPPPKPATPLVAPKPLAPHPAPAATPPAGGPSRLAPAMRESSMGSVPYAQPSSGAPAPKPGNALGQVSLSGTPRPTTPTVGSVASAAAQAAAQQRPQGAARPPMPAPPEQRGPSGPVLSPQELLATEEVTDLAQGKKKHQSFFSRFRKAKPEATSTIQLPQTSAAPRPQSGVSVPPPPPRVSPRATQQPAQGASSGNTVNLRPPGSSA